MIEKLTSHIFIFLCKKSSAAIAARLKLVLQSIIRKDKSGILPGRFTGDKTRFLYNILYYTGGNNIPRMILL